jgi:DNA-binding GntR family transcriptional regulator
MPPTRPPAKYVEIADDIRRQIEAGELRPGDQLPFKRALATRYEVSEQVIDAAMIVLRTEGWVEGWQGKGVFVAARPEKE